MQQSPLIWKAMSNKKLEIGVIGGAEKRVIEIISYDDSWPLKYVEHKNKIIEALGDSKINIEHIGSTAVPHLSAKPIIDILLVVKDSSNEDEYLDKMESAGYQLRVREPDFHEHRMFRTIERDVHIHILSNGSSEIERYISFRNRLRTNGLDRNNYEKLKLKLATKQWEDMNEYAEAKSEIIERIIAAEVESR